MEKLSDSFALSKYGIEVRLVEENDVGFIYNLRSDKFLTRHIHGFNGTVEDQLNWLKSYKEREKAGKEYYFIYLKEGKPFGVNRIYGINGTEGTTGSWICLPGTNPIDTLATIIILYDIVFDLLKVKRVLFDTRKDNHSALKVNKLLGGEYLYETEQDYYFELLPEKYFLLRDHLIKFWHIK